MLSSTSVKNYLRSPETVSSVRMDFILALIPIIIWSIMTLGLRVALVIAVSVITVILSETIINLISCKKFTAPSIYIVYCGIFFALTLFSTTSILMCVLGAFLIPVLSKLLDAKGNSTFFIPLLSREIGGLLMPGGLNVPEKLPYNDI